MSACYLIYSNNFNQFLLNNSYFYRKTNISSHTGNLFVFNYGILHVYNSEFNTYMNATSSIAFGSICYYNNGTSIINNVKVNGNITGTNSPYIGGFFGINFVAS